MYAPLLATAAALLASTAYADLGSAIVINACKYDVQLRSVPAQFGGYDETDHTLSPGQSWTQQWTQLSNGAGWSIKLAKDNGASSIMQYEYTYQNDGTIWYDLSCVDGNPWDKNWQITAVGGDGCTPKQSAYRFATDDAYGMQSCLAGASVTVTLCSGESQNDKLVSSIAAAVASPVTAIEAHLPAAAAPTTATSTTTPAPAPPPAPTTSTTEAPAPAPAATTQTGAHGMGYDNGNFFNNKAAASTSATPTTFATAVTTPVAVVAAAPADDDGSDWVTVWETVVETAIAYETYVPGKRHVHHPEHPHFR